MRFVFTEEMHAATKRELLSETDLETCAVGLARESNDRLIVHRVRIPREQDYAERRLASAQLRPEFLFDVAAAARRENCSLIFLHTHPRDAERPTFSKIDDAGETRLAHFLEQLMPGTLHGAIVMSPGGISARQLATKSEATVFSVGRKLLVETGRSPAEPAGDFDRQVRAFGAEGQAAIANLRVGIVGLGGTGSLTAQQLTYLGVQDFALVDFDPVDRTSLNRLVGATPADVGVPKVKIAERGILTVNRVAKVRTIEGDVGDDQIARQLLDRDVIFGCTDSHASRAILGQIAYQYLIPLIDMGVSLSVRDGMLAKITGRIQLLAPGLPCFTCLELLDSEQIRRELLTPEQRAADRYIQGAQEPQPSVISLNSTVSSLAVSMFLGLVTEAPLEATFQRYDGLKGLVRPVAGSIDPHCYVCAHENGLARADSWPLPTRAPRS